MKILIANITGKDHLVSETIVDGLDFTIDIAKSVNEVSEQMHLYEYDCILIHCNLEDKVTDDFLYLVEKSNLHSGLILISDKDTVEYKIKALNAGADDYLSIPYHVEELRARILAIVRRKKFNVRNKIHFGNIIIDLGLKNVFVWNNQVALTKTEYEILIYLMMNKHRTVTQLMLSEYIWSEDAVNMDSTNVLIAHIKNLRKKLNSAKAELEIKNIYAVGYQIVEI